MALTELVSHPWATAESLRLQDLHIATCSLQFDRFDNIRLPCSDHCSRLGHIELWCSDGHSCVRQSRCTPGSCSGESRYS